MANSCMDRHHRILNLITFIMTYLVILSYHKYFPISFINKKEHKILKRYRIIKRGIIMKKVLYVVLKNTPTVHDMLEELKNEGFNGTLIGSNSLRHTLDYFPEEHTFLNLRHLEDAETSESIMCMFVWEEDVIEIIKEKVRKYTNNFKDLKGFMFSKEAPDFEGTM